ncbi:DUF2304 domain-containing protein [Candidatus Woesearchaeota archaeon]|nr:DUF2304 domain-containing protein [Candidatus Woesearchaeota archaeon]
MILGIQILGALFGMMMLYISYMNFKRKDFTVVEGLFWMGAWVAFIVVSFFPDIISPLVKTLSLARAMDLFIILGFMFLVASIFYCYTLLRKLQKKMEQIVRKIAIKK